MKISDTHFNTEFINVIECDNNLINEAKNKCISAIHGHTHIVKCEEKRGIRIINSGSYYGSRCEYPNGYMICEQNEKLIELKESKTRKSLKKFKFGVL